MPNRLNLPGYNVLTDPNTDAIHATFDTLPDACPECGCVGRLHRWGKRDMTITDTRNFGKQSRFTVTRVRLKCMECNHTFMQPLPGIDDKRRLTTRAVQDITARGLKHTYALLAEEYDLDPKTIANIVLENTVKDDGKKVLAPFYLGMDEVMVDGEYRCIFTDIANRQIIDFLPNRKKATVKRWLRTLGGRGRVKAVTIDMWDDYRKAVYDILGPGMTIVVDKYHVTSKADDAVERTRVKMNRDADPAMRRHMKRSRHILTSNPKKLSVQEQFLLSGWLLNYPILKTARDTMQSFKAIYNLRDKAEAEQALDEWLRNMPSEVELQFGPLISALTNWRREIMNYFDHRITNAFTEAMNKKVKSIARDGAGYDFDTMRMRVLQGYRPKPAKGFDVCVTCGRKSTEQAPVTSQLFIPAEEAALLANPPKPLRVCPYCAMNHRFRWRRHGIVPTTES